MKVDIENGIIQAIRLPKRQSGVQRYLIDEFIINLKKMRSRVASGDMSALDEFFNVYEFSDDDFGAWDRLKRRAAKK